MAPHPLTSPSADKAGQSADHLPPVICLRGDRGARASVRRSLKATVDGAVALQASFEANSGLARSVTDAVDLIAAGHGRVVVSGVGKSGHIGRKIAATLASTGIGLFRPSHRSQPWRPRHGDLGRYPAAALLVGRDGGTREHADLCQAVPRSHHLPDLRRRKRARPQFRCRCRVAEGGGSLSAWSGADHLGPAATRHWRRHRHCPS